MKLEYGPIAPAVVDLLATELRAVGVDVQFLDSAATLGERCGTFQCESGAGIFMHDRAQGRLRIEIMRHHGHFPEKMIIGGLRQLIEECVERQERQTLGASASPSERPESRPRLRNRPPPALSKTGVLPASLMSGRTNLQSPIPSRRSGLRWH